MDRELIDKPHDKLFHVLFSREESAAGFLREVLPPEIARACDWDRLRVMPGTFVASNMKKVESDRLFQVPVGGSEIQLYVLFEHQSTADKWMPLRLLTYMTLIWKEFQDRGESGPAALPPIYPLVLYQGSSPWNAPMRFSELVVIPPEMAQGLRAFTPDFAYAMFDLARTDPEEIPGPQEVRTVLKIMRAVMQSPSEFLKALEGEGPSMDSIIMQERFEFLLNLLIQYALVAKVEVQLDAVSEALRTARNPNIRSTIMSVADQLIAQGREEERRERLHSARATLIKFLKHKFGGPFVARVCARIEQIRNPDVLDALFDEALIATDPDAFDARLSAASPN
jgi:hypothetical protein